MNYGLAILGVLLVLSLAGNGYFWHERDKALAAEGQADQLNTDTRAAAGACSKSVEDAALTSKTQLDGLRGALAGVAPAVAKLQREALAAQMARPDDPQDLCGSLLRFLRADLAAERGMP